MGNPRIENVTETWQMLKPDPRQDGDTHVYDMDPERDDDVKTTLKSAKYGEDFFGYHNNRNRYGGKYWNGKYNSVAGKYRDYYNGKGGG